LESLLLSAHAYFLWGGSSWTGSIQGDFESCADILTCDRTPQKVTIVPIMPYTNVDMFREKGAKSLSKKFESHWIL
jgi:hypothetical protein